MAVDAEKIQANLAGIRERVSQAAANCGRAASDVQLVVVTKYVGVDETRILRENGCVVLGESRPQELMRKTRALSDPGLEWHLIGHLQRNKVRSVLPLVDLIHSCDSLRLLDAINREAMKAAKQVSVLLEVNISGESEKHGFAAEALPSVLTQVVELRNICVQGLMGMARRGSIATARQNFSSLRELRDQLLLDCPCEVQLKELSMGMSNDFEVAIEEGATIVRIGSALFQ
ncbi:MAG: YggS family pyridoxal phosphate-dependent enzyme [Pirellulaceae bacterium]|nr:YggS family pyridoxal phosphate-dependent enzyme [Pirellulaceae bacterium]